ncbi:MAG TPA: ribosome maturation factor RimP [Chryseolinea sp.]|jgi:ribosome maturation factor RimP|nr:ribosome maturation factor RimP [Chryseolinea sp.]
MEFAEEIKNIITRKLADPNQFLVDVIVKGHKGPKKVLIIIDSDKGVTIDDCANLSREISKAFDDLQLFDDSYMLEVSTPGLDQPLRLARQYYKNIGRRIKVVTHQQAVEGKLVEVGEDKIKLEQEIGAGKHKETKIIELSFLEIDKTFVLVSFK